MLDSLALAIALIAPSDTLKVSYAPAKARIEVVRVASIEPTESLTTCYVNADNTCWSR
jgi:hypothetical protein